MINIIIPLAFIALFQLALFGYAVMDHRRMVKKFNDKYPQAGKQRTYSKEINDKLDYKNKFSQ